MQVDCCDDPDEVMLQAACAPIDVGAVVGPVTDSEVTSCVDDSSSLSTSECASERGNTDDDVDIMEVVHDQAAVGQSGLYLPGSSAEQAADSVSDRATRLVTQVVTGVVTKEVTGDIINESSDEVVGELFEDVEGIKPYTDEQAQKQATVQYQTYLQYQKDQETLDFEIDEGQAEHDQSPIYAGYEWSEDEEYVRAAPDLSPPSSSSSASFSPTASSVGSTFRTSNLKAGSRRAVVSKGSEMVGPGVTVIPGPQRKVFKVAASAKTGENSCICVVPSFYPFSGRVKNVKMFFSVQYLIFTHLIFVFFHVSVAGMGFDDFVGTLEDALSLLLR